MFGFIVLAKPRGLFQSNAMYQRTRLINIISFDIYFISPLIKNQVVGFLHSDL